MSSTPLIANGAEYHTGKPSQGQESKARISEGTTEQKTEKENSSDSLIGVTPNVIDAIDPNILTLEDILGLVSFSLIVIVPCVFWLCPYRRAA